MKIDQSTGSSTPLRLPVKARAGLNPAPASVAPQQQSDAPSNVRQMPNPHDDTFDAAKVQAIREEIRSGRYQMDPRRIADGLLENLRQMLPGSKG